MVFSILFEALKLLSLKLESLTISLYVLQEESQTDLDRLEGE